MTISVIDWNDRLSSAKKDNEVGINIASLLEIGCVGTYITELAPGAFVMPHYHNKGHEQYHIVSGTGTIRLSPTSSYKKSFKLICKKVKAGNSFVIKPNVVHQLVNTGKKPLTLIFSCPTNHLGDDRYVIGGILDGCKKKESK